MRLATLRLDGSTTAVRVDRTTAVEITGIADVSALLERPSWRRDAQAASGRTWRLDDLDDRRWAPVVPQPRKIICVGLNYRRHITEMGRQLPAYPTLFAKYPEALIGPYDPIVLPAGAAEAVDWEAELALVIGTTARNVNEQAAQDCIAGYTVINDVTMRDYQYRTPEWFQGKTFEGTAPIGPWLVTAEDYVLGGGISCTVGDERMQDARTDDLVFSPAALVSYISGILTLSPGDVIATGTPGGVGHARTPARYLADGDVLHTRIDGIGALRNPVTRSAG